MTCSFVGKYEEVQHLNQPYLCHQNLYNKATSAVPFNSKIGDSFPTTVGVRQGCLASPTLFRMFLDRIITDALEHHEDSVSTGRTHQPPLCWRHRWRGGEEELTKLLERLDKATTVYGMEISAQKTKLMTNNNTEIKANGQKLKSFHELQVPVHTHKCWGIQALDTLQDSTPGNSRIAKVQPSLGWQDYFS